MSKENARLWAQNWKVDEVIEAVEYSKAGITDERWHAIEAELHDLAPTAYDGDGVPMLSVWDSLPEDMQQDIYRAYLADYWPES